MGRFPRLVRQYRGRQAVALACYECDFRWDADDVDDFCEQAEAGQCVRCGSWDAGPAYYKADPCPGCGTLGHHEKALDYCCSKRCQLQAEYAKTLRR